MWERFIFELNNMQVTPYSASIKIFISLTMGFIVGLERQSRRQNAGLRTISLICLGSTGAMLLSIWIPQSYSHFQNGDPGRIAAQIITGIGFLGAGTIIQSHGSVHGLTSAACIWVISIVGMCIGAGLYIPAFILTLMTLFVLIWLERMEKRKMMAGKVKLLSITYDTDRPDIKAVVELIKNHDIYLYNVSAERNYKQKTAIITCNIQVEPQEALDKLLDKISEDGCITGISLKTL